MLKNVLKVIFLIMIVGIVLLSGCSPKILNENRYIKGEDSQFYYYCSADAQPMAESEKGYYFFSGDYLYCADKSNMTPVIVCDKPNCLHDEETDSTKRLYCNAFFQGAKSLFYYKGSLYIFVTRTTTTSESELLKVSLDGTKRKSLFKVDGIISAAALHRGTVYYAAQVWDADGQSTVCVNAAKLNGRSKEIYKDKFVFGNVSDILCYGNYVYMDSFDFTEKGNLDRTVRYNTVTGETKVLFDNPVLVSTGIPSFINDKMYFRKTKLKFPEMALENQEAFIADIDGNNLKSSFDPGFPVGVNSDGQYLYAHDVEWSSFSKPAEEQRLTLYTIDGEVVDSIPTGSFGSIQSIIPGGKNHMFLQQLDNNFFTIYYAEKSQISTGKMQWKLLFKIEQGKMRPTVKSSN